MKNAARAPSNAAARTAPRMLSAPKVERQTSIATTMMTKQTTPALKQPMSAASTRRTNEMRTRFKPAASPRQLVVLPFEEEQRLALVGGRGMQDFADVNRMVAAVVGVDDLAFDVADRAVDEREAALARAPFEAVELRHAFRREAARDFFLVDRKSTRLNSSHE